LTAALIPIAQQDPGGSGLPTIAMLVVLGALFYFLLIRPQQRRARQQRELMASLEVGDEVITLGGLFGTIRWLDQDRVRLEVAPGVELTFVKNAIARKVGVSGERHGAGEEAGEPR
jgi:preprotein translocase subunit YajC